MPNVLSLCTLIDNLLEYKQLFSAPEINNENIAIIIDTDSTTMALVSSFYDRINFIG